MNRIREISQEARTSLGALQSGQSVAIIGGGPGRASCAIALKNLAAAMGKEVDVVLYKGKVFSGEMHYNQCVGVLSPPLDTLRGAFPYRWPATFAATAMSSGATQPA